MTKLKPITETSWLVIGDTTRIGLLTQVSTQYLLMVQSEKKRFMNRKEVNDFFKEDIFKNIVIETEESPEAKDFFINGYPVDFDNPQEVLVKGNTLPLFSKKATSEIYYCAGYYCLNFPKNWMPAYCPKLSTVQTYEYAGPFKTEIEMRNELTRLRKIKSQAKKDVQDC